MELVEFEGKKDHEYLLITYPPKVLVSKWINSLKVGVSSIWVRKNNYPTNRSSLCEKRL
ncbi:MAG: hypothetical protein EBZ47_05185 [Chlamydiae bacterium]|nr:hypothetical protein [Chlamydiota bacterium]